MKDFAVDLRGCSKEDAKKIEDLALRVGLTWEDKDRFDDSPLQFPWDTLIVESNMFRYQYASLSNRPIYFIPQDWDKIKQALGVEVKPKCLTYKGGSSLYFTYGVKYKLVRVFADKVVAINKFGEESTRFIKDFSFDLDNKKAQEVKQQNPIITETSKLRGRLLKKSKKIEELKKENKRLADLCNNTNSRCVHLERKNEEFYDENKRLNQVLGVANQQAALVLYENKYLIEKNSFLEKVTQDQAKKIKDLKAAYSTLYLITLMGEN